MENQNKCSQNDEILTIEEVALRLKISKMTAWRWINLGKLPAFKIGSQWRVKLADLNKSVDDKISENINEIRNRNETIN